jgi:hypothetical protein
VVPSVEIGYQKLGSSTREFNGGRWRTPWFVSNCVSLQPQANTSSIVNFLHPSVLAPSVTRTPFPSHSNLTTTTMPRITGAFREPKPPPHRSRSQHSSHELQSNNASSHPRRESDYDIPPPEAKAHISTMEGHLVAASGEFVGTFMFLFFCFSGQLMITNQASERSILNGGPSSQQAIFTALLYGFSLLVNVWAFYRISGGLFNPAVCLPLFSDV